MRTDYVQGTLALGFDTTSRFFHLYRFAAFRSQSWFSSQSCGVMNSGLNEMPQLCPGATIMALRTIKRDQGSVLKVCEWLKPLIFREFVNCQIESWIDHLAIDAIQFFSYTINYQQLMNNFRMSNSRGSHAYCKVSRITGPSMR